MTAIIRTLNRRTELKEILALIDANGSTNQMAQLLMSAGRKSSQVSFEPLQSLPCRLPGLNMFALSRRSTFAIIRRMEPRGI